jgi:hypothetical protein
VGVASLEGIAMKPLAWAACLVGLAGSLIAEVAAPNPEVCVVVGAPGQEEFGSGFVAAAHAWQEAATRGGANCTVLGMDESKAGPTDRDRLKQWISERAATSAATWIVYLGHGTFDGREARLNLRGPDATEKDLATWLEPLRQPVIFIHGGSAGAPFIPALSKPERIIITATRSGHELNYARFGERFANAVASPAADIDQDGETTLLEAFVTAAQQTQAFYAETGRLATEHALIDDNGDKQGTPAEWFHGKRVQRQPNSTAKPDGARAALLALVPSAAERALTPEQRELRKGWEAELESLRAQKPKLPEDDYYRRLESIARKLGSLYRSTPQQQSP